VGEDRNSGELTVEQFPDTGISIEWITPANAFAVFAGLVTVIAVLVVDPLELALILRTTLAVFLFGLVMILPTA
jgi:hypothetical protein